MIPTFDLIIVTADEPYRGMSHTQILYADFFAKQQTVLYVEPPKKWRPWHFLRLFGMPAQQHNHLFVHTYVNALPSTLKIGQTINEHLNEVIVKRFLKQQRATTTLIWHFDSYRSVLNGSALRTQSRLQHIYHVIDPFYNNPVDAQLREISKVVVVTSPRNISFYENVKDKVLHIPQCVDLVKEKSHLSGGLKLDNLPEKFLVLLGTLSDDIDFNLLKQIAQTNINLLIIGKTLALKRKQKDYEDLKAYSCVHFTGMLAPADFYPLLKRASAGIIAYDLTIRNGCFSPLKVINYLIAGIPVISNCETEILELQTKGIYETFAAQDYLTNCREAIVSKLNFESPLVDSFLEGINLPVAVDSILQNQL